MERTWSVRVYEEGDEKKISELWKAVHPEREYNQKEWMGWWNWMYKENPAGKGKILLAIDAHKIVGQYPLIFMNMKVGNGIIKASQNINLMTHPDYRYQGIFSTLERKALGEVAKEGVYIIIGFPNKAAYPGHIKSGWFDISAMKLLFKPINWENALKLKINNKVLFKLGVIGGRLAQHTIYRTKKVPVVKDLTITKISSFDDRIAEFWNKISDQHKIMIVREKNYLNWRYTMVPNINYAIYLAEENEKICGYIVLRCVERKEVKLGYIFDLVAPLDRADIIWTLLSKATEYFKEEKTDLILYNMIADKTYQNALKRSGFISSRFIKGGQFCVYSSSPSIHREFLNKHNWFVQIGDSDFI